MNSEKENVDQHTFSKKGKKDEKSFSPKWNPELTPEVNKILIEMGHDHNELIPYDNSLLKKELGI
jgi:hypothetical protein